MKKTVFLAAALILTACSSPKSEAVTAPKETPSTEAASAPTPTESVTPAATKAALVLAPDGLSIAEAASGKPRLVRFGIARASAERAIGLVQGQPLEQGSSSECGAGTIDYTSYKDDLQLTFQDDTFVGWTINGAESPLRTGKGIGIGSTRQDLDAAYKILVEDSSLGILWGVDDLVGLLDQDGIEGLVTGIWAGTVCLID